MMPAVRRASDSDAPALLAIFNDAIAGGAANTEPREKDLPFMLQWLGEHDDRYAVFVYETPAGILGYASLNRYFPQRIAYRDVADLSYYVSSTAYGRGVGTALLEVLLEHAASHDFHKCVARSFTTNTASRKLLDRFGFRRVGVFEEDALVAGERRSVAAYEKLLLKSGARSAGSNGDLQRVGPGCSIRRFESDENVSVWLAEMEPGAEWPRVDVHDALGEYAYVVDGELIEGERRYPAGSYVRYAPHSSHRPRTDVGVRLFGFNLRKT